MSMVINTNLSALNTANRLKTNSNGLAKSLEKLSSGLKINSAADDAANLAISENMRTQIRGLDKASENAQTANSLLQTADGALRDTVNILQKMHELADKAASETNDPSNRKSIQDEIEQLKKQIDKISNDTGFNNKKLLDGNIGVNATLTTDNIKLGKVAVKDAEIKEDKYTATLKAGGAAVAAQPAKVALKAAGNDDLKDGGGLTFSNFNMASLPAGNYKLEVDATNHKLLLKDSVGTVVAQDTSFSNTDTSAQLVGTTDANFKLDVASIKAGLADGKYTDLTLTAAVPAQASSGGASLTVKSTTNSTGLTDSTAFDLSSTSKVSGLSLGQYTLTTKSAGAADTFDITLKDENGVEVAKGSGNISTGDVTLSGTVNGVSTTFTVKQQNAGTVQEGKMVFTLGADLGNAGNFAITNNAGSTVYTSTKNQALTSKDFSAGGFEFKMTTDNILSAASANQTSTFNVKNNSLIIQVGANEGETMRLAIGDVSTKSLGIDTIDVTTTEGASKALTATSEAIKTVAAQLSTVGAYSNRLSYTIDALTSTSENLTSARSLIIDTDMAAEMAEYTKKNVLTQAATAMLAQANQQPQQVLKLLG